MSQASDSQSEKRSRVSLWGKGWAIMRGGTAPEDYPPAVEPAAAEAPGLDRLAAPEYSKLYPAARPDVSAPADGPAAMALPETEGAETESLPLSDAAQRAAQPGEAEYVVAAAVEALIPQAPETLSATEARIYPPEAMAQEVWEDAGMEEARAAAIAIDTEVPRPAPSAPRPDASDLFGGEKGTAADDDLLTRYVTDERLDRLWGEVEDVQTSLASAPPASRIRLDTYQKELLQASTLLLQNRANYDDVRAMVYRLKADLARDEQTAEAIHRYKPRLLAYFAAALVAWVILMLLEPAFARLVNGAGLQAIGLVYHPTLFGLLGGIISGYFTLNKHTVQERDFDPEHISWYLMNPLIGAVMGLLMTLVFGTGIVSTIGIGVFEQTGSPIVGQYPFLLWVMCFLAGYNQAVVLQLMARTFNMLRGADADAVQPGSTREGESSPSAE